FQAEDGIRDFHVTGVQTCALPICIRCRTTLNAPAAKWKEPAGHYQAEAAAAKAGQNAPPTAQPPWPTIPCRDNRTGPDATCRQRSEERRVGKESKARKGIEDKKKK